ncbi:MAG: hypothetical protein R2695_13095 [Acidimicrobiales bacterium]
MLVATRDAGALEFFDRAVMLSEGDLDGDPADLPTIEGGRASKSRLTGDSKRQA